MLCASRLESLVAIVGGLACAPLDSRLGGKTLELDRMIRMMMWMEEILHS